MVFFPAWQKRKEPRVFQQQTEHKGSPFSMRLLITNDDGFHSPGLHTLCRALQPHHEIYSIAPLHEQSGVGQAISIFTSITAKPIDQYSYALHALSGTPSDCVKFAICHLYQHLKFDLVICGINPGENAGLSAIYSGTVAAAREANTWGLPAMALSTWDKNQDSFDFAAEWLVKSLSLSKMPLPGSLWNINFPACPPHHIAGLKICRMGLTMYRDVFIGLQTPRKTTEYWLEGEKPVENFVEGTDDFELKRGFITLTPLGLDQTDYNSLSLLHPQQFPTLVP